MPSTNHRKWQTSQAKINNTRPDPIRLGPKGMGFDPVIGNKLSGVIGDTLIQGFSRLWRGYRGFEGIYIKGGVLGRELAPSPPRLPP
jgi:hypothetical protein